MATEIIKELLKMISKPQSKKKVTGFDKLVFESVKGRSIVQVAELLGVSIEKVMEAVKRLVAADLLYTTIPDEKMIEYVADNLLDFYTKVPQDYKARLLAELDLDSWFDKTASVQASKLLWLVQILLNLQQRYVKSPMADQWHSDLGSPTIQ